MPTYNVHFVPCGVLDTYVEHNLLLAHCFSRLNRMLTYVHTCVCMNALVLFIFCRFGDVQFSNFENVLLSSSVLDQAGVCIHF